MLEDELHNLLTLLHLFSLCLLPLGFCSFLSLQCHQFVGVITCLLELRPDRMRYLHRCFGAHSTLLKQLVTLLQVLPDVLDILRNLSLEALEFVTPLGSGSGLRLPLSSFHRDCIQLVHEGLHLQPKQSGPRHSVGLHFTRRPPTHAWLP